MSGVFQNIDPPPPHRPSSVYPHAFTLYTRKYFVVCWVSANFLLLQFKIQRICSRFFSCLKGAEILKRSDRKDLTVRVVIYFISLPLNAEACWHRTRRGFQNLSGTNIAVHISALRLRSVRHRLINYIDTEAKCRHLKNWPVRGLCSRCFQSL